MIFFTLFWLRGVRIQCEVWLDDDARLFGGDVDDGPFCKDDWDDWDDWDAFRFLMLRGQNDGYAPKVRVLETRSGRPYGRRLLNSLDVVCESLDQSSMESDYEMPSQDSLRTSAPGNHGRSSLAIQSVLPLASADVSATSDSSGSLSCPDHQSNDTSPSEKTPPDLAALRVAALRDKFKGQQLTSGTQYVLTLPLVEDSPTNRSYKNAQLAFVEWSLQNSIDINEFSAADLTNFLSQMRSERGLHLNTVKLWRSAVTRFHRSPNILVSDPRVSSLLSSLARTEPPRRIHRPTIDLTPTLQFLAQVPNSPDTSLGHLQPKLAFLLGMAGFMRPSDLHRISRSSAVVDPVTKCLTFMVVAPKERRNGVRIVKPYLIHPHSDSRLCPVALFTILSEHPQARASRPSDVLFVKSNRPCEAVCTSTISSWLRKLIRHSSSELRVSVLSLASSMALREGVALDDILTLGNWRSADTFQNYYRREHLSQVDFTNQVLNLRSPVVSIEEVQGIDQEDIFHDAVSDFSLANVSSEAAM